MGRLRDRWLRVLTGGCALLAGAVLVGLVLFVAGESGPALRQIGVRRFVTDPDWQPALREPQTPGFNLFPALVGSVTVSLGAVLWSVPVSVLAALFWRYYAPRWLQPVCERCVQLFSAIPSVVFGYWGLVVIIPWIAAWRSPGPSTLAGILVLGIMLLPTVTLFLGGTLQQFPREYWLEGAALGLSRDRIVRHIVLPCCRPAILAASLIALARAWGETMAVMMVCGNVVQIPRSLFDPVRALTVNIAMEMPYAQELHRSALFVNGLVLFLGATILVALVHRWVQPRVES